MPVAERRLAPETLLYDASTPHGEALASFFGAAMALLSQHDDPEMGPCWIPEIEPEQGKPSLPDSVRETVAAVCALMKEPAAAPPLTAPVEAAVSAAIHYVATLGAVVLSQVKELDVALLEVRAGRARMDHEGNVVALP